jgi:phage FluMu protein Com
LFFKLKLFYKLDKGGERIIVNDFRCNKCHKLLGKYRNCLELEIKCPRCGSRNSLSQKVRNESESEKELCFATIEKRRE